MWCGSRPRGVDLPTTWECVPGVVQDLRGGPAPGPSMWFGMERGSVFACYTAMNAKCSYAQDVQDLVLAWSNQA
jgi:hypothetical protein